MGPEPKADADPRRIAQNRVRTARPSGEPPFPAVLVEQTDTRIRVYDLSSPLPVLRTFAAGQLAMSPGATWSHADAVAGYSDDELRKIRNFVRWASGVN